MPVPAHQCALARTFAENVREQRERQGMSQEELAERAGVHRTYIGMIERCEKNVTIYNIERIAEALEAEPGLLLTVRKKTTRKSSSR